MRAFFAIISVLLASAALPLSAAPAHRRDASDLTRLAIGVGAGSVVAGGAIGAAAAWAIAPKPHPALAALAAPNPAADAPNPTADAPQLFSGGEGGSTYADIQAFLETRSPEAATAYHEWATALSAGGVPVTEDVAVPGADNIRRLTEAGATALNEAIHTGVIPR